MKVIHVKTDRTIANNLKVADTFFAKLKGMMFADSFEGFDGLMLPRCNSIHNCFVRFPLDVIFTNKELKIVKIIRGFRPWRFSWIYFGAQDTFEFPEGTLDESILVGDQLEVRHV